MSQRYTVVWSAELEQDYTDRWLAAEAAERRRLTIISNSIDRELRFAPMRHGFQLKGQPAGYLWRIPNVEPPALALFDVFDGDRLVYVRHILLLREPT